VHHYFHIGRIEAAAALVAAGLEEHLISPAPHGERWRWFFASHPHVTDAFVCYSKGQLFVDPRVYAAALEALQRRLAHCQEQSQ
jgi:hypothetical protein